MSLSERQFRIQEENIPQQAHLALKKAQQDALDAGYSVLTVRQNVLVEISPDGSSQVRNQLSESVRVVRGQKIKRAS